MRYLSFINTESQGVLKNYRLSFLKRIPKEVRSFPFLFYNCSLTTASILSFLAFSLFSLP
jgi:hypothetical protein